MILLLLIHQKLLIVDRYRGSPPIYLGGRRSSFQAKGVIMKLAARFEMRYFMIVAMAALLVGLWLIGSQAAQAARAPEEASISGALYPAGIQRWSVPHLPVEKRWNGVLLGGRGG
jgi:hypothetical protein